MPEQRQLVTSGWTPRGWGGDPFKSGRSADDERSMRTRRPSVGSEQAGFTLVELMVAVLILVVGLLGVVTMLQTSDRISARNNQRIGATNLARELIEQARTVAYQQ